MLQTFFASLFGCAHQRTTFPLTCKRKSFGGQASAAGYNRTYVVCLDCGKEFDYDWKSMRVGEAVESPVTAAVEPLFR